MFYELTSQPSGRGGIVSDIFDQRRTPGHYLDKIKFEPTHWDVWQLSTGYLEILYQNYQKMKLAVHLTFLM